MRPHSGPRGSYLPAPAILSRPAKTSDLHQRPSTTSMRLVHTEEISSPWPPASSGDGALAQRRVRINLYTLVHRKDRPAMELDGIPSPLFRPCSP